MPIIYQSNVYHNNGVNIYDEWQIVYNNINNINFTGDCISAAYNPSTWHVDVMFSPVLNWSGCDWDNPYILSLCWASVDLSCLVDPAPNVDWSWCDWVNPYQLTIWTYVVDLSCLADPAPNVDWSWCDWVNPYQLTIWTHAVDLSCLADPAPNVDWSWCDWVNPYQLTIWTHVVDLSCLADESCPCPIEVQNVAFVMKKLRWFNMNRW